MSRRPPRRGAPPEAGDAAIARTGRRGDGRRSGTASAPGDPEPSPSLRLPPSGLAHEILAAVDRQPPAGSAEKPGTPGHAAPAEGAETAPTEPPPSGPTRIYSFADSLERGHSAASAAAAAAAAPPERPESWVTFELAGELYALPVARIQEIQRAGGITRVPHAPPPVRGIANLRGKVLVVVDLRLRLGLPPAAPDEHSRILVVSSRQRSLGLLVDAAHQVLGLLPSRIEPPPADLMDERSAYLAGVVQLDDSLVIALDIDQLLLVPEEAVTPSQTEAGGPP